MLDKDLLDPVEDLPPHLQAVYGQMAAQSGGRNNKAMQFRQAAVMGMSPSDVLARSYDEQKRREDEKLMASMPQQDDVRKDPRFFVDAHALGIPGDTSNADGSFAPSDWMPQDATPAGNVPGVEPMAFGGMMGSTPQDALPAPNLGGMAGPTPTDAFTQPGQNAPTVNASQIDTSRLEQVYGQIQQFLNKPQTEYTDTPLPAPNSASAVITALAMALAPPHHAGNILQALTGHQQAIKQRNDILAKMLSDTQNAQDKQQLESLFKQAALEETRAYHQAGLNQQADITNAGNKVKTDAQNRLDERAKLRSNTSITNVEAKIKAAPLKKAQEMQAVLDFKTKLYQDNGMTYEEARIKASDEVNASDTFKLAQTENVKARTLTEDTLRELKGQNLTSQIDYRNALKDYLPDRIAAQFAGVLIADERVQQQFQMFRQGLDEKAWEMTYNSADAGVKEAKAALAGLKEEAAKTLTKRTDDVRKAKETMAALGPLVLKADGTLDKDADPVRVDKYSEAAQTVANANSEDDSNTQEAIRQAEFKVAMAEERLKGAKAQRPAFRVGAPASGGSLLDKAKGMLKGGRGKRPPPMGGNVPVDPTGPGYDRTKVSGNIGNPYL